MFFVFSVFMVSVDSPGMLYISSVSDFLSSKNHTRNWKVPRLGRIPHHSISRKSEDRSELLDPARRNRRCNAAANGNIWHHCLVDFPVVNSHLSTSLAPSDRSEVTIGGSRRDKITKLLVGKTGAEKYPSRNTKTVNYGRPIGILRWKKIRSFYRLRELVGVSMDRISSY